MPKPVGSKDVHKISEVNTLTRTAVCRKCGPCKVKPNGKSWRCKSQWNRLERNRKRRMRSTLGPVGYRKHKGKTCERCNFIPEDLCQLDVHHKDGNHTNNAKDNLQTLCANCHRLITVQEKHGMYRFHYPEVV